MIRRIICIAILHLLVMTGYVLHLVVIRGVVNQICMIYHISCLAILNLLVMTGLGSDQVKSSQVKSSQEKLFLVVKGFGLGLVIIKGVEIQLCMIHPVI